VPSEGRGEQTVVVHRAESWTEAVVIRGLLESAGIASPSFAPTDPFPAGILPPDFPGIEILVRESQAEDARRIIEEYLDEQEEEQET
jgi:Putative prokaryotic signal transducing protein